MTVYQMAELPRWAEKVTRVADAVLQQATSDMLSSIEVVPGINRGGSRVEGTIPRDFGALASSLQTMLYGSTAMTGVKSYVLATNRLKLGDVINFSWGGNVAPYAPAVHYGANGVDGTLWIYIAAMGWSNKWVPGALTKARRAFA